MGVQERHVIGEFQWQPEIVGIEEGYKLPTRMQNPEIAASSRTAVYVSGVFEMTELLGILRRIRFRYCRCCRT